ncbi:MAG: tRNA pseudouridine(38-40) synthase TruA [Pseudomonadota bacterium]
MPRYALRIEYDGRPFAGWQRQDGPASVQQTLEEALRVLDPALPSIAAAGRTDAGVHATGQVAHADMSREWDAFRLSEAVNWHLKPAPVAVTACARVDEAWHARFSAVERRYTFRMIARRAPLTLDAGRAWRVPGPLDAEAMRAGAAYLVGRHDFTTFRASICQAKSPVKSLDAIDVEALPYPGGQEIRLHLRARSFLHNQVRSIAGTLERVGAGAWPPERVREVLEARDRAACGPVAPPDGLCLTGVSYPSDPFSPSR